MTNENSMMDSQGSRTDIPQATPGAMLKAAREAAKLSEDDIATELRIPLGNVQSLESDQYENLASETFVLGYIRAYARILQLDAESYIKAYHQYRGQLNDTTATLTKSVEKDQEQASGKTSTWRKTSTWVAGFLVAWLLLFNLFSQDPETQETLSAQSDMVSSEPVAATAVVPEVSEVPGQDLNATNENVEIEAAAIEAAVENTVEAEAVTVQETAAAEEVAEPVTDIAIPTDNGLDTLVMTFSGECWLEVTDARGDVLSADLQQDGDQVVLQGEAPFEVMLGNVRAVTAVLNDEPVDLQPRGFRKTLRTKIGE